MPKHFTQSWMSMKVPALKSPSLCSMCRSSWSDSPTLATVLSSRKRTTAGAIPIWLSRKRKQISSVATCNNATLWSVPRLNEGRVSVSMPRRGCDKRKSTARSASPGVSITMIRPGKTTLGNCGMSFLSYLANIFLVITFVFEVQNYKKNVSFMVKSEFFALLLQKICLLHAERLPFGNHFQK